jgi:hypothetical protein
LANLAGAIAILFLLGAFIALNGTIVMAEKKLKRKLLGGAKESLRY